MTENIIFVPDREHIVLEHLERAYRANCQHDDNGKGGNAHDITVERWHNFFLQRAYRANCQKGGYENVEDAILEAIYLLKKLAKERE